MVTASDAADEGAYRFHRDDIARWGATRTDSPGCNAGRVPPTANQGASASDRYWRPVARYLARAPGTHVLLLIVAVTTLVLRSVDAPTASRILRHESTNLVQMSRDAPRVLLLSAFVLDQGRVLVELAQFTLFMVPVERWIGTYRWLLVFSAGHVGATLATTIGIWLQVRSGAAGRALVYPVDVGVSYGLFAVAGVAVSRLPRPASTVCAGGLCAFLGSALVRSGTFTDWGHVVAVGIGFALAPLVRPDEPLPARRHLEGRGALAGLWEWLSTPPAPRAPATRRRARLVLAGALLAVAAGLLVLLGMAPDTSVAVASTTGTRVPAVVVGPPAGCRRGCRTTIVRYNARSGPIETSLVLPSGTVASTGDRLDVIVSRRTPGRVHLPRPARRVQPAGLFGATSVAAACIAASLLVTARRSSRARAPVEVDAVTAGSR